MSLHARHECFRCGRLFATLSRYTTHRLDGGCLDPSVRSARDAMLAKVRANCEELEARRQLADAFSDPEHAWRMLL